MQINYVFDLNYRVAYVKIKTSMKAKKIFLCFFTDDVDLLKLWLFMFLFV